uniref:Uncharacterized protein n=1 Tax=viral metagenome TaxID=1070528 RepID=A0A6M3M191_9ZZZZ
MFYAWDIKLIKGLSEATRQKSVLKLEKGTITKFELVFPSGCCGLVFVHINQALHQVFPKNPGDQLTGNGSTIVSTDEYELKEPPLELEFYGWNTDEIYDHTITVRIQLVPAKEILHRVVGEVMRLTKLKRPT